VSQEQIYELTYGESRAIRLTQQEVMLMCHLITYAFLSVAF